MSTDSQVQLDDQIEADVVFEEGAPTEAEWNALSAGYFRSILAPEDNMVGRSRAVPSAKNALSRVDALNQVNILPI
jgi:hypothetical protein